MKIIKKLCIFLLAFSLVLPIFSNIKAKAELTYSLEDMSEDEIVDLIFNSCKDIYPKEGQTTEEYDNYLNKKIPFLYEFSNDQFKNRKWTRDDIFNFVYSYDSKDTKNKITSFSIRFGKSNDLTDNSYQLSKDDDYARFIYIMFNITNYDKAVNIYDKLSKKLESYYLNITNDRHEYIDGWKVGFSNIEENNINKKTYSYDNHLLYLSKILDTYEFSIYLVNANDLANPGPLAIELTNNSTNKTNQPKINYITNKKSKKIVVKYIEENASKKGIYTIQYSTNKNFKNAKEVESKKTSTTISKLKKNKTYYVRVKYTIDGQSSDWSEVKTIKIKK